MPRNPEVNFYLKPVAKLEVKPSKTGSKTKKPRTKKIGAGKLLIYLNFKYSGMRLFYSFGERISPSDWNKKKQRAINKDKATVDGKHTLNDLLDNLKKKCEEAYRSEKVNGIPAPKRLRDLLDKFLRKNLEEEGDSNPTLYQLIERFKRGEIKYKGRDKASSTLHSYKATLKHLQEFEKKEKFKVDFGTIGLDFYYRFLDYMMKKTYGKDKKLQGANNIGKHIKNIKAFMNEAVDLELTNNLQFRNKKFIAPSKETDAVYLSHKEIIDLYKFDLTSNKRLERVRDLFVFASFLGQRFSDFSDLQLENIVNIDGETFIKLITKKTKDLAIIPCNPVVLEIFEKYKDNPNKLPKSPQNSKFNSYIKEVCSLAGLNEKGRLSSDPKKELWKCISSHTCRRNMATNLYLDSYPVHEIMKVTNHKTEKAFLLYIRVSKLDAAKNLSAFIKRTWSEKILRVA